ncbi:hypothetical protein D3Y57_03660 (plasmid) [Sphingomonas paeninsulae]|uniref:3-keto-5-aminohexanoate cleavage protein n=1 Tax=Sphingomonas paeninsulae TaxID=2319844 RepID=A0A494T832_SPHPE|nr:hypothetical protein D3Y57_03660 [Sphingomonas paeninsulae]
MYNKSNSPVVLEAAITPLRRGEPVQRMEKTIADARACLAAGAAIIHHHHDFRAPREEGVKQMVAIERAILETYPDALMYGDYLKGDELWEKNAHLRPMFDDGVLRMFAIDPGITQFDILDERGLPTNSNLNGLTYAQSFEMVQFAQKTDVPMSLGIYEPGQLRWVRAYAERNMFPAGTIIKLYFGGPYTMGLHKVKGVNFGMHPTKEALDIYLSMMEGIDLPWIVSCQAGVLLDTPVARYALERGGHLRVGIEDTAGGTEMTNVETVDAARALAAEVGRPVAEGRDAKNLLKAKQRSFADA